MEILLSFFPMIQLARQLLTRQLRLPIFLQDGEENVLEACAGKLDGATADERIRKEIEEELGYNERLDVSDMHCFADRSHGHKRPRAGFDPSGTLEAGTSRRCSRWLGSEETIALNAHIGQ